jgi:hypothetical protein
MAKKVNYRTTQELSRILGQAESNALLHLRKNAATNIVSAVQRLRSDLTDIRRDPHLTPAGRDADIAERRKKAKGEIETQQALAASAIEVIRGKLDTLLKAPPKNDTQALLEEMRIASGWTQASMLLQAGQDMGSIVQTAAHAGDKGLLAALARYAPAYLQSKGHAGQLTDLTMAAIEQASRQFYTEEQALAADVLDEIEMGESNLSDTAGFANHSVDRDGEAWPKVGGWQQGEVLDVFAVGVH